MAERLSPVQRECLEAAAKGPLFRRRNGWTLTGVRGFATNTVEALSMKGLLKIDRLAGCAGEARITKAGREALSDG